MHILKASSGITVLFRRAPSKLIDMKYYVRCGALDEKPGQEGMCHALEHMYFQGTATRDWEQIVRDFRKSGSYYNAETGQTYTMYHTMCPREHFEKSFVALSDMFYNANFPAERWEIEQGTLASEILVHQDSPEDVFGDDTMVDTFGENYHGIVGKLETIQNASVGDVKWFSDQHYRGKNIFLSVTGNLTHKQLLRVVDEHDQWTNKRPRKKEKLKFRYNPEDFHVEREGLHQTHICLLAPIKRYKRIKEQVALDIGMDLLYNYLYEKLIFEKGLCYKVAPGMVDTIEGCECIYVDATCIPERAVELTEAILKTLRSFLAEGLTSANIEESRLSSLRGTLSWEDSVDQANRTIALHHLWGYKGDPFEITYEGIKNIKDITVKSIMAECLSTKMKLATMVGE